MSNHNLTFNELDEEEKNEVLKIRMKRHVEEQSKLLRSFVLVTMLPDYYEWYEKNGYSEPTYSTYCKWLEEQDYDLTIFNPEIIHEKVIFNVFSDAWYYIAKVTTVEYRT